MDSRRLKDFIHISPGFKAAVNLKNDRDNLQKVAGFIPTEVSREIILDLAKKLHPNSDLRSRIIMGTYGTGKSHLALVLLNLFLCDLGTKELQIVVDKLDYDTQKVLKQFREQIPNKFLIVNLYGDEGDIADGLMMGLRKALIAEGLEHLLPTSAYNAALARIKDIEENYKESYLILKSETERSGMSVDELKKRLLEYQKKAFDLFRRIHPQFSSGGHFQYTTMLSPKEFYTTVVKELIEKHGFSGIAIFWDEFGHKMGEVVKDPTGKEGLILQEFAECCNSSETNQIHFYIFCHRSLKEYHDISMNILGTNNQQLEDDLRKIEGRFKQYIMKSTDVETFQLINAVIVADENSDGWKNITQNYDSYFESLVQETAKLKYFTGFTEDELERIVIFGTYPLHPMAVYSLPAISEKVAQNNRTLFTCLCEDESGSFKRFLDNAFYKSDDKRPPMFTVDRLWDYFSNDVKQQERTSSIFRDFEKLKNRLDSNDLIGLSILKAVSIFLVTNPARIKITDEILFYSLNIPESDKEIFKQQLHKHSNFENVNNILMRSPADGTYRLAVSRATESLKDKIRKLLKDSPENLRQSPVQYLKSLWNILPVSDSYEATSYGDDFGVIRQLAIEPVSINQLKESLHILTKNLGSGSYLDGILLVVLCSNSIEIREAIRIASEDLIEEQYQQIVLAIPKEPVDIYIILKEHQALDFLKNNEAILYGEGGELYDEWKFWDHSTSTQLKDIVSELFTPEKQMLDYYWLGQVQKVLNNRQLKKLASSVMYKAFPYCPIIGEPKLTFDDFGGNWGYRKDCRDITLKLSEKGAAKNLWNETASAPKHVITQLFKSNGLLRKNSAGDFTIEKPKENDFIGANKTWECIEKYINRAKQQPIEMRNLFRALRKPPYGIKCRSLPLFFAAVAHRELALGNISFEYQRSAKQIDKITSIENDTLEKVFTSPDKYKLVYVNVSSNQNALINGLVNIFDVTLSPADPPLERVKKVGNIIGTWWRALPKHAQISDDISDEADILKNHIFYPLAEIEPDTQQIILKDAFLHVFDTDKKVNQKDVESLILPIKNEFENLLNILKNKIFDEYRSLFDQELDPAIGLSNWYSNLSEYKKDYVYSADPAMLIANIRKYKDINEDTLIKIAEDLTGLNVESWADDLVVKFSGKLESAKKFIDTCTPVIPTSHPIRGHNDEELPPDESQGIIIMTIDGENKKRIFDMVDELSPNGIALENILNSMVDQLGKGLDEKEKIAIFYRFAEKHIFGA